MKKITYNSPVILTFSLISAAALILNYVTQGFTNQLLFSVYPSGFLNPLTYVRLFGHVLGHVDVSHFASNMTVILLIGPMLEEKYGSKTIAKVIGIVAVVTGLVHMLIARSMLLGASGVVYAFIILSSFTGDKDGIPLTFIIVAIIYLGDQIIAGMTTFDSISQLTHILGGITGAVIGWGIHKRHRS